MSNDSVNLSLKVQPNAGKNEVVGSTNGVWRIKISAPPDKGKANKELIEFLSDILGQKKDHLTIIKGHTSHNKLLTIEGLTQAEVNARLSKAIKNSWL
jgi:uncharacterized protein (TIGR00251 family)